MHPAAAFLAVVVVVLLIYVLFYKSDDSAFISSVAAAKAACDKAVVSQLESDFSEAIAAAATAKTNYSGIVTKYANSTMPAEVTAAVTDLNNLVCGMHVLDAAAIDAISTATAACNAAVASGLDADSITAAAAKKAAQTAIDNALAQYSSGTSKHVTAALDSAIDAFGKLQCSNYPTSIVLTKTPTLTTINDFNSFQVNLIEVYDAGGAKLPVSAFDTPYFTVDNDVGYSSAYPAANALKGNGFSHSTNRPVPCSLVLPLLTPTKLSKIFIRNRSDGCCTDRLNGVIMSVMSGNKAVSSFTLTAALQQTYTL